MKNLLILFFAAMMVSCSNAQPEVSVLGEPNLTVNEEVHDFGQIAFGSDGVCTFTITNTGSDPLIISKCEKTCGCTVPKCNNEPILSGKTSDITVTYDTKRTGPFNKSIQVHSNDPDEPIKVLRIKGEVLKAETDPSNG